MSLSTMGKNLGVELGTSTSYLNFTKIGEDPWVVTSKSLC